MTCIIGTTKYVCADRRISEDGGSYSSMIKVASNPWIVAATAGLAKTTLEVKRAVRNGAHSPEDLLEVVDKGSYALVLTWDGKLVLVSEGTLWPCTERVHAIGTGADLALGFLAGARKTNPVSARAAQRFVARRRTDCGGGCDVRSFGRK